MFSGNTSGVLFLVSRDYPNCFTVRLRLPPSKQLDEVALQVAKRSAAPDGSISGAALKGSSRAKTSTPDFHFWNFQMARDVVLS